MDFIKRLSNIKIKALNNSKYTFITSMLVNLITKLDDQHNGIAYTDGNQIVFGNMATGLSDRELLGLMFHELMHVVLRHNALSEYYANKKKFNLAADFYIDMDLIDSLELHLPEWGNPQQTHPDYGGHYDNQFRGMNIKQIYDLLPDDQSGDDMSDVKPNSTGGGASGKDDAGGGQGRSISEMDADDLISTAQIACDQKGVSTGSAALDRLIKDMREPTVPWQQLLEEFVTENCREGRSYRRLNRRYDDMFMPTPTGKQLGRIALSFDLSCSVTDAELAEYMGNIRYITNIIQPKVTEVVGWSTQVDYVREFYEGEDFTADGFHSGGGTDPQPMMDHFAAENPELLVIFTDGEFWQQPDMTGIGCPVVWIIVNNQTFDYDGGHPVLYINVE